MEVKGIFHIHTSYSFDSLLSYKKVVKYGIENKLDFIAITDHNTIESARKAREYKETKFPNAKLNIIIGAEYSTEKGDIIGLFLQKEVKADNALEVVEKIKQQGGIVVLPHPFKDHQLSEEFIKNVDIIEVFNGKCSTETNEKARNLAEKLKKPTLVGSDAHFYSELDSATCIFECDDNDLNLRKFFLHSKRKFVARSSNKYSEILSQVIRSYKLKSPRIFIAALKYIFKLMLKR